MSDEVISTLVEYVQTKCLVDESLIEFRKSAMEMSQRAREIDVNWKKSGPHTPDEVRAMESIPKVKSVFVRTQEILSESSERQIREIENVKSLALLLLGESQPNPIPLLRLMQDNDKTRLSSDIRAAQEVLEDSRGDLENGEKFVRETVARGHQKRSKRFWKTRSSSSVVGQY
jgi:hypothetical protein